MQLQFEIFQLLPYAVKVFLLHYLSYAATVFLGFNSAQVLCGTVCRYNCLYLNFVLASSGVDNNVSSAKCSECQSGGISNTCG